MRKVLEQCPGCGGPLVVTELHCNRCDTTIRSQYALPAFGNLTEEQVTFIKLFLRARGNMSEMEKVLGISYPSIRNKLEEINGVIEASDQQPDPDDQRSNILRRVAEGNLSAAEALQRLQSGKG